MTTPCVAVAGGSLGGLTVALLLRDLGYDVTIYERSHVELEQRGAGIGSSPTAPGTSSSESVSRSTR